MIDPYDPSNWTGMGDQIDPQPYDGTGFVCVIALLAAAFALVVAVAQAAVIS